jgi:hypothetical protein
VVGPGCAHRAGGGPQLAAAGLVERLEVGDAHGRGDGRDRQRRVHQEVAGALEAAAPDVRDHGGAGRGVEQAREVVVGQADRRGDAGDRERARQVRLDVGQRRRDGRVGSGAHRRLGRQLGEPPQDGPDLGGGPGRGVGGGGDGAPQGLGERGRGRSGVLHERDRPGRAGVSESKVDVEVFGGAPVAEAGLGVGRDEADPAGPDPVGRIADDEFGLVVVQVQLPQVGQAEDLLAHAAPVQADARLHGDGGRLEMESHVMHGENGPPVGD